MRLFYFPINPGDLSWSITTNDRFFARLAAAAAFLRIEKMREWRNFVSQNYRTESISFDRLFTLEMK